MQKYLSFCVLSLALTGCGEQSAIEDAIRANLRDPDSAKFRNLVVSQKKATACIEWNAKNAFGGYGDWDVARLKNIGGSWVVLEMQVTSKDLQFCTQKAMDTGESIAESIDRLLKSN